MPTETGYTAFLRDLPRDWQTAPLSAIAKVVGGGTPSRDVPAFWGGDIPWVTPGEISGERFAYLSATRENISALGLSGSGATLLPASSLMVTTRATLGARAINLVPMTTNQGFKSLVFERESDALFFYYLTDKLKPELKRRASGTTFLEVSGAEFAKIEVPLPPVRERQLIAEILDALDTTIRQSEAIIEKLKQVKQGLLHDLLTRGIDANGELRPPQSQAPHLYKASTLGWIPSDWDAAQLGTFAYITKLAGYEYTNHFDYAVGGEVICVRVLNLKEGALDLTDVQTIPRSVSQRLPRSQLHRDDLVLSYVGTIGEVARIPDDDRFHLAPNVAKITVRPNSANPEYLAAYIASAQGRKRLLNLATVTSQPSISMERVRQLQVPLTPLSEQGAISRALTTCEVRIGTEQVQLACLAHLKFGLMDDLLTGRIRVTPLLVRQPAP